MPRGTKRIISDRSGHHFPHALGCSNNLINRYHIEIETSSPSLPWIKSGATLAATSTYGAPILLNPFSD
jgi:hypothetical protein